MPFRMILKIFLKSFLVNAIVCSAHLFYDKEYTNEMIFQGVLYVFWTSAVLFLAINAVMYAMNAFVRVSRENFFWILLGTGFIVTIAVYSFAKNIYLPFTDAPNTITLIAVFANMVSICFEYVSIVNPDNVQQDAVLDPGHVTDEKSKKIEAKDFM